jgi:hypothetical protein
MYRTRSVAYLPDQHSSDQDFCGAEDGIRTRDPHLGKVGVFVRLVPARPVKCGSVHPVSSASTRFASVVERSTIAWAPNACRRCRESHDIRSFRFPVSDLLRTVASG